jgi:hypothetical protein
MATNINVGKQLEKHKLLAEQSISGKLALFASLNFKSVNTFQKRTKYFNIHCQISSSLGKRFTVYQSSTYHTRNNADNN